MNDRIVIELLNHRLATIVIFVLFAWVLARPFIMMAVNAWNEHRNEVRKGSPNDMTDDRSLPRSHRVSGFAGASELEELDMDPRGSER